MLPPDYFDSLIGERDAAAFLHVSVRTVQNWRVRGGGPQYVRISARAIRYCRRDLMDWIKAHRCANSSQGDPSP